MCVFVAFILFVLICFARLSCVASVRGFKRVQPFSGFKLSALTIHYPNNDVLAAIEAPHFGSLRRLTLINRGAWIEEFAVGQRTSHLFYEQQAKLLCSLGSLTELRITAPCCACLTDDDMDMDELPEFSHRYPAGTCWTLPALRHLVLEPHLAYGVRVVLLLSFFLFFFL